MMMETFEDFRYLGQDQLTALSGGGFAYDLGRAFRFLGISGGGVNIGQAILDWTVNEAINEAVNGG